MVMGGMMKKKYFLSDVQAGTWSCLDAVVSTVSILWCCIGIHSKHITHL